MSWNWELRAQNWNLGAQNPESSIQNPELNLIPCVRECFADVAKDDADDDERRLRF